MIYKPQTIPPEPEAPVVEPSTVQRVIGLLQSGEPALLGQDMHEWAAANLKDDSRES